MYTNSSDSNSRIGVIIPFAEDYKKEFVIILDENNRLWYAKQEIIERKSDVKPFCVVFFRFNAQKEINYIWVNDSPFYVDIEDYIDDTIPLFEIQRFDKEFKRYNKTGLVKYQQGGLRCFDYFDDKEEYIGSRAFCIDEINRMYHEIPEVFLAFIKSSYNYLDNNRLPFDVREIMEIYNTVFNFNPYEVFESYRIEISHEIISRPGRDDYYFEYKKFSICYIDGYLRKWFKKGEIELHRDRGYTNNFKEVNEYHRFVDQEEIAKEKAYKEYNKQEHFDFLLNDYYIQIKAHLDDVLSGKANYEDYNWFPNSSVLKQVYYYLNTHLSGNRRTNSFSDSLYEFSLSKAIDDFNHERKDNF